MKAWSPSALKDFQTCPKRYYHLRVAKDVKEDPSPALEEGARIHRLLENRLARGARLPEELQHLEAVVAALEALPQYELLTETRMAVNQELAPVGYWDKSVWLRTQVDAGAVGREEAVIYDYKTGKRAVDSAQLAIMAAATMFHYPTVQIVHTTYVWTRQSPVEVDIMSFHRDKLATFFGQFIPAVEAYQEAHRTTTFPARPSGLCRRYCPVRACPHWGS